jgi:hypothetical protein
LPLNAVLSAFSHVTIDKGVETALESLSGGLKGMSWERVLLPSGRLAAKEEGLARMPEPTGGGNQ